MKTVTPAPAVMPAEDYSAYYTEIHQRFLEDDVDTSRAIARVCSAYIKLRTSFAAETMNDAAEMLDQLDTSQKVAEEAVLRLCPEMLEELQAIVAEWQRTNGSHQLPVNE